MEKLKLHTPDMVMLLETKTRSSRYVFLKEGTGNAIYACDGGTWLKWGLFIYLFIEVGIKDVEKGCVWRFFGVYASTDDRIRRNQWQALRTRILTCQEAVMIKPRSKEETLGLKGVLLDIHLLGVIDDKRKEYKNGWTGGSYHVMFCLDTHETKRRKKGHFAYDPRWGRHEKLTWVRRGLLDWKRREWKNSQLCIDELRLELRAEYQNDIFDYGKVKELEFKLQKALVGKVKELEFKFKISHIFREGNHRVDALANHGVQGSGFTW
ncbi:unnamed protein product [Prunus armeniaca]